MFSAHKEEISASLAFLHQKKLLTPTDEPDVFKPQPVDFAILNDGKRHLDIQKSHLRFLDIAKHRTHDAFSDRCFQGLTVAAPQDKMEYVRKRIVAFLDELNDELTASGTADTVFQIQCQAFKLL